MIATACSLGRALPVLAMLATAGCSSLLAGGTQAGAGIAAAGIASSVTRSATVATGIGLGVAAAANAGLQYEERRVHRAEQDRIAAVAGTLDAGGVAPWSVSHDLPIEADEHGEVAVIRAIATPAISCKAIVFSVDTVEDRESRRAFYTAAICQDGARWKWASAEPATERWGSLQ